MTCGDISGVVRTVQRGGGSHQQFFRSPMAGDACINAFAHSCIQLSWLVFRLLPSCSLTPSTSYRIDVMHLLADAEGQE